MAPDRPASWVDRLSETMRDHEKERGSGLRSIPRYEIRGELGRGGMGVVYRAWDPQLGREVALKVLQAATDDAAEARERFLREAQLAARLSHPNIVGVYDIGEWEGRAYLAMQLVEGATLEKSELEFRTALGAVRDAARALDYAHQQGIVHRDIKPSNLMLDRHGRLFITDFGLARRTDVPTKLTLTGVVIGTPFYMSPEQARGAATDARSDVYSLGATMYELVTGRSPFTGADAMSVLLAAILKEPDPPRFHNEGLPREVETIVLKAMEKDPAKRYPTAGAMADDLQRFLEGDAILARRTPVAVRLWRRIARHPWRAVAGVALLGLLAAGGFIFRDYRLALRELDQGRAEPDLENKIARFERAARWFAEAEAALPALREELEAKRRRDRDRIAAAAQEPLLALQQSRRAFEESIARCRKLIDARKLEDAKALFREIEPRAEPFRDQELLMIALTGLRLGLLRMEFDDGIKHLAKTETPGEFRSLFERLDAYGSIADRNGPLAAAALDFGKRLARKRAFGEAVLWLSRAEGLGISEWELYEQRALARMALDDWDGARDDYAKYRDRRPGGSAAAAGFAPLFLRRAAEARDRGDWLEALGHLEDALKLDRDNAQALHDYGRARFRARGLSKEALGDLASALEKNRALKPHADFLQICLVSLRQDGAKDADAAIRLSDRVLDRLEGDLTAVYLERAKLRRGQKDFAGALAEARRAGPGAEAALTRGQLAYLLARSGPKDEKLLREAAEEFGRAVVAAADDPRGRYWRGVCRHLLGGPDLLSGALDDLTGCLTHGFARADAGVQAAKIHLDAGRWKEAIGAATRALEANELSADEWTALLGESQNLSREEIHRRLRRDAHYARARACFETADLEGCIRDCTEAAKDAAFASAFYLRGYAHHDRADYDKAVEDFGTVIRLNPKDAEAYVGRGTVLANLKRFDEAIRDYDEALKYNRRSAEAWAGRGTARAAKGDRGAEGDYREALRVAPQNWPLRAAVEQKLK